MHPNAHSPDLAPGGIRLSVWSDYVCPFCYLELPVLDELQQRYGEALTIEWRAFELRPNPVPTLDPDGEYLHRVWNSSVYPMAAARGMTLKLPPVQPRSRKAMEAAEHARAQGRFDQMHRALFRAFFELGRDLGDVRVLVDIGTEAGLEESTLERSLRSGDHAEKVLADQALAQQLNVQGVPAMLIQANGQAQILTGAQPIEQIAPAIAGIASRDAETNSTRKPR